MLIGYYIRLFLFSRKLHHEDWMKRQAFLEAYQFQYNIGFIPLELSGNARAIYKNFIIKQNCCHNIHRPFAGSAM